MTKPLTKTPKKKSTLKKTAAKKAPAKKAPAKKPSAQSAPAPAVAAPSALTVSLSSGAISTQTAVQQMAAQAMLLKVTDDASALTASTMLSQLKTLTDSWEDHRTSITKPLNEAKKRVDALFKPTKDSLELMTRELKKKVLAYTEEKERAAAKERIAALQKAEEAQADGDHEAATAHAMTALAVSRVNKTTLNDAGQTQLKEVWTFEVHDLSDVPRQFLVLDEQAVRSAIRAGVRDQRADGSDVTEKDAERLTRGIPGINIFQTFSLAVTGA